MSEGTALVLGTVGSRAYNMDHPGSDVDRLGVYALPTRALLGFRRLTQRDLSRVTTKPDVTWHEAGKFCRLAASGNPSALELLYLERHDLLNELGWELITIRERFLSQQKIREAYLGYVESQLARLRKRPLRASWEDREHYLKFARHVWRLAHQGRQFWLTGHLPVKLSQAHVEMCRAWAPVALLDPRVGDDLVATMTRVFERPTPLPLEFDEPAVETWLQRVRRASYQQTDG
jgi:predicted nucleotidyltransferase